MISLQTLLGHKFDDLVNEDRPDLRSADGHRLGIEVTRAMEPGKAAAQQMLKDLSGITAPEDRMMAESGYLYGIREGNYVGGMELNYWKSALPMRQIIASKVSKVNSGFYGMFDEFGLFVFSKDALSEWDASDTVRYIRSIQKDNEIRYARLFLSCIDILYACNLEDGISDEFRITAVEVTAEQRRSFFLSSLRF